LAPILVACVGNPDRHTLAGLRDVKPDLEEVQVDDGLVQAMAAYRSFLAEAPESALTPEAMRRLADLKLEKEYGILGGQEDVRDGAALPAPESASNPQRAANAPLPDAPPARAESDLAFERRAVAADALDSEDAELELPGGEELAWSGPLEAIELYDQILATYPNYQHNDQVLYQKARAYDELGRNDEAIEVMELLIARYPHSRYVDEVQFRRGEYFFVRRKYLNAEEAYQAVTARGPESQYYELALYKLGWALYKQELHEEAVQRYIALLDYKVSVGYDFDQTEDENDERRIADTYRVISLSFSSLGGPPAVLAYFTANGSRSYEDGIYRHLGEFYLEKLRYHDAAEAHEAFIALYPLHRVAPHFSMRVVEIYEKGGFPKLVLESRKSFASRYGLPSEYWLYFDVAESPEVLRYLKENLEDLANHYHALYQVQDLKKDKAANFREALHWYRAYLASFPEGPETPPIHYRLADLLLENRDFAEAALEYERIAYDYPEHEKASPAGYAAIYAHREHYKAARGPDRDLVRRGVVASTLRFVDTFPAHLHSAAVLGAAVDDLYDMKEFAQALATGERLIAEYPDADKDIRRSAWLVVAHASLDTDRYEPAELAYGRVLEMTEADDESRHGIADNLAASIYKQGEQANLAADPRAAADHFLRIKEVAPSSKIRPVAEYDAGVALIQLEDWAGAAVVLESFRETHPEHELHRKATVQMAYVRRKEGDLARAAQEYERVSAEAEDPEQRREALLLAGELYEESQRVDPALAVYLRYVERFPEPLELSVETRFKIATLYRNKDHEAAYHGELRRIVEIDGRAGDARSDRIRYLGAQSALVLTEALYHRFDEIELVQPFEKSLQKKQRRMDEALEGFTRLVDYEVGDVTAAATYYMAEVYFDFSQALLESERPGDLSPADLQDYEMVLEEEAFPFEERAIDVHEKNLELMSAGVYNRWIEKSLGRLAVLMPGRYAKFEASSGLIASIDTYAYRAPGPRTPEPGPGSEAGSEPAVEDSEPVETPESETPSADLQPADGAVAAG
jgi:TolA-binding protein